MEVTMSGRLYTPAGKTSAARTEAQPASGAKAAAREDKLTLSQQAMEMLEKYQEKQKEIKRLQEEARQMKEANKQQAEALEKELKTRMLCWKIAARIMAGDKVPHEDEQFLLNNDPAGYQMAMSLRKIKEDPEEYDTLLEDEEEGSSEGGASSPEGAASSGEAVPAEGGETAAAE